MLRYRADLRTLGFIATYFALVFIGWNIELPLVAQAFLFVAVCSFSWFCAVITHNTIHCPMFRSRGLNRAMQVVLTQTYGHPVSTFVPGHNLSHHKFTQQPQDVMRTTKVRFSWNLLNLLLFFPTIAGSIMKGEREFVMTMRKQRPRWFRQLLIEAAFLIGIMVALAFLDWRRFLVWWYLPHVWAAFGIVTINLLQHDGCDADHAVNHSRNFTGRLFGWWTFNNGFHAIHHMKPSLHWSLTRAAHDELVAPHNHPELNQKSMAGHLFKTYIWPGKRLRYDGEPLVLPAITEDQSWVPGRDKGNVDFSYGAEL
ncbi:MAG: fatty acid desaturase [Myxococcota bacterium]|jgi:fatty acid desaturase